MQRIAVRALVAVAAFNLGFVCFIAVNRCAKQTATTAIPPVTLKLPPQVNKGWKTIGVAGLFSLYVPPDMTLVDPIGDSCCPRAGFSDGLVAINYLYTKRLSDFSCYDPVADKELGAQISNQVIAGKPARIRTWSSRPSGSQIVTLCFSDLGDHKTRLHFGAISFNPNDGGVIRQIIESIQFP